MSINFRDYAINYLQSQFALLLYLEVTLHETRYSTLLNFIVGISFTVLTLLLNQLRYQTCPTCLMARADASAGIAVEIFIEGNVIAPVRVILECFVSPKNSAASI